MLPCDNSACSAKLKKQQPAHSEDARKFFGLRDEEDRPVMIFPGGTDLYGFCVPNR
jgi:hypothetical protein